MAERAQKQYEHGSDAGMIMLVERKTSQNGRVYANITVNGNPYSTGEETVIGMAEMCQSDQAYVQIEWRQEVGGRFKNITAITPFAEPGTVPSLGGFGITQSATPPERAHTKTKLNDWAVRNAALSYTVALFTSGFLTSSGVTPMRTATEVVAFARELEGFLISIDPQVP